MKFESKYKIVTHELDFEYVICEMKAILSRGNELKEAYKG